MLSGMGVRKVAVAGTPIWDMSSMAASYDDSGGATTTYGISVIFRTDGSVDVTKLIGSDLNNEVDPYVDPASSTSDTWVRCLYVSGSHMTAGDAEDTWLRLDSERTFTMTHTSAGGNDEISGTFNFELSSESDGTPEEAAKDNVNINVGETF